MSLPTLSAAEQRVLGCLLEKQVTVPASYPLSLNSLRLACNQSSSRDPVMELDERSVEDAARHLREIGLANVGWADSGRRTRKYSQTITQAMHLTDAERAVLTVLLLRGPQTSGELNTRTERLHGFADKSAVEACLAQLAAREPALARQLERRAGQHDARWVHLLGPVQDDAPAAATVSRAEREAPLSDGAAARDERIRASYAAVAPAYADHSRNALAQSRFEAWLLGEVGAIASAEHRPVVDAGCGTGVVTSYLAGLGVDVTGVDVTPEMVDQARKLHPELRFEVGDLRTLMRPAAADGWGAVVAWYVLMHFADSEFPGVIAALARPLAPRGVLALAMHAGTAVRHKTNWLGQDVDLSYVLREPAQVVAAVEAAGLTDVEWYRRGPISRLGETTERLYVTARRP